MDAAWMTRGNGKFTNSNTGHAELIGVYSGDVLASGRRHRHCHLCKTKSPADHECHTNWRGSSKAMEADIITNLVLNLKGARVTVLVGDEDSATMSKIREKVPWQVQKVTDVVHAKKNFGSALFAARHKLLTPKIIEYLKDCMSYALHQNQDRPDDVKAAILNIPSHVFNDHENCGMWCRYKRDPENYKHKRLPEIWAGSEDSKKSLKVVITSICEKFAAKAKSLAPCLSSNVNESFNFVVTTFAPKNRHYGGTMSIDRRIDGAVLQKNKGVHYVMQVNKQLNLSPGDHTEKHRLAVAAKMKRKSEKSKLPEEKVKRKKIFKLNVQEQLRKESSEGVQYSSAMGFSSEAGEKEVETTQHSQMQLQPPANMELRLDHISDANQQQEHNTNLPDELFDDNQNAQSANEKRGKKVQPRKPAPIGTPVAKRCTTSVFEIVVLDTETTGTGETDEIVQLAAKSAAANFNEYSCPSVRFNPKAGQVNKLTCRGDKMYQAGQLLKTLPKKNLLLQFIEFLIQHQKPVLLLAHNADFDLRLLRQELTAQDLTQEFLATFVGYCDTIMFFKAKLPKMSSYSLKAVCNQVMGEDFIFKEHDASGDVDALWKCLDKVGFGNDEIVKFSISSQAYLENVELLSKKKKLSQQLAERSAGSVKLTDATIKSLVTNNLDFNNLLELSRTEEEFSRIVTKCFKQRAKARCEELLTIFCSFNAQ